MNKHVITNDWEFKIDAFRKTRKMIKYEILIRSFEMIRKQTAWTDEWKNERTDGRMNEWRNEKMDARMNELMNKWKNQWMNERMNE